MTLLGGGVSLGHAATLNEKESLRGLSGIVLKPLTFIATPRKAELALPLSELTKEIESQLGRLGILLDESRSPHSHDHPFLEIEGAVTQIAANYYAYTIVVELHQEATLRRNATRPWVVTWSAGALSTGDIQKFQERLRYLVGIFIQDFQQVNHSSSPAAPHSANLTDL